jgi:hypothetical protein
MKDGSKLKYFDMLQIYMILLFILFNFKNRIFRQIAEGLGISIPLYFTFI